MMSDFDLLQLASVPVCWIVSELNGKLVYSFSKPELLSDRMLEMAMAGHQKIQQVFSDVQIGYMGKFLSWRQPF